MLLREQPKLQGRQAPWVSALLIAFQANWFTMRKTKIYAHAPSTRTGTSRNGSPGFLAWNTNPAQIWESFYVQAQVTTDFITLGLAAFDLKRISHLIVYNLHSEGIHFVNGMSNFCDEGVSQTWTSTTTESHWNRIFHAEWLK